MPVITIREALNQALDEEMTRDKNVIIIGEEVAEYNGPYKVTKGLLDKYGAKRVIDTPITELGFTGIGVGAAVHGMRPVIEWMTFNFGILALDQIINNAAKYSYMSGGEFKVPLVVRGPNGHAEGLASQHSQSLSAWLLNIPGLKVVSPATPYDAKGLLKAAIRDDNPVMFLESEMTYQYQGEVPNEDYIIPLGKADVKKRGEHLTLISFSKPILRCMKIVEDLERQGISVELIDLRSLRPLDEETIYKSIRKTNRAVIVDEGWPQASVASYISHLIYTNCFDSLDAPIELVTLLDVPMPYNINLELEVIPNDRRIIDAIKKTLR